MKKNLFRILCSISLFFLSLYYIKLFYFKTISDSVFDKNIFYYLYNWSLLFVPLVFLMMEKGWKKKMISCVKFYLINIVFNLVIIGLILFFL